MRSIFYRFWVIYPTPKAFAPTRPTRIRWQIPLQKPPLRGVTKTNILPTTHWCWTNTHRRCVCVYVCNISTSTAVEDQNGWRYFKGRSGCVTARQLKVISTRIWQKIMPCGIEGSLTVLISDIASNTTITPEDKNAFESEKKSVLFYCAAKTPKCSNVIWP